MTVTIANPSLWWPNGYGEQPLYTTEVELLGSADELIDARSFSLGLRTVELRCTEDSNGKSFTFVVNGVPIFICEAGWVDANQSVADGCEVQADADPHGNTRADAVVLGTLSCGMSIIRAEAISSDVDNDWFVVRASGASCPNNLQLTLAAGGGSSTDAWFDVDTDMVELVNQTDVSLVAGTDYSIGSDILVRVHPAGAGTYGPYNLTVQF